MHITLIGTRHEDIGKCNSGELHEILVRLNPEVIFEEMPQKDFEDYYLHKTRYKLESISIMYYIQSRNVIQVAVDMNDIPEREFMDAYRNVFKKVNDQIDQNGFDFRSLTQQYNQKTSSYGFEYLNSSDFYETWLRVNNIIEDSLKTDNDQIMIESFLFWKEVNAKREVHMLQNIFTYCQNSKFNNAVFLVGAVHKNSIIYQIPKFQDKFDVDLTWSFEYNAST